MKSVRAFFLVVLSSAIPCVTTTAYAEGFVLPIPAEVSNTITVNQTSGSGPSLNGTSTYDGVALLSINKSGGTFTCSGSLLLSGRHVLTAAHCADGLLSAQSSFLGATSANVSVVSADIYPGYTGNVTDPRDIAVLTLATEVFGFARYDIYRSSNEVGQIGTLVGYGREGNGATGSVPGTSGNRRQASNYIDTLWAGGALAYDFDNYGMSGGTIDPFGSCNSLVQTGVPGEGMIAPGDSGGPLFLMGQIAGVHSWGGRDTCGGDVDSVINSSWGEFGASVRVSNAPYTSWIDSFIGASSTEDPELVPEPSTWAMMGLGLVGVITAVRRKTRR